MSERRVAVVGAGIVGLAVAYQLTKAGARVTVIDRDPDGDSASVVNAGGIAVTEVMPASAPGVGWRVLGWMADPLGPLAIRPAHAPRLLPWLIRFAQASKLTEVERISRAMAALNARVYGDLVPMLDDLMLSSELHANGALTLYGSEAGYRRDAREWAVKRARGIVVEDLTGSEARQMEPALGPKVHRAVFMPQWSHIDDPRHLMRALRRWLVGRGVVIETGEARRVVPGATSTLALELEATDEAASTIAADRVVLAAGAWSGALARRLGDRVVMESERGYNVTLPSPGITVSRELIFAEGRFVATPLSCGLRIGGAAEFGGLRAAPNFKRCSALLELARRSLPDLNAEGGTNWAGHRPTTPDSLPVVGPSEQEPNVFYAFGHGHFGLTQAATTGRLICDLILGRTPPVDLRPYSIGRFRAPREIREAGMHAPRTEMARHTFFCIDAHTCGNPVRVVTAGAPLLPGLSMAERRQAFVSSHDWIRRALMFEPRGHDIMSGVILYPSIREDCEVGFLFIEVSGCLPMCGHGTIGTVTTILEEGLIVPRTDGRLAIETPAGRVEVEYTKSGQFVEQVGLFNVASYLHAADVTLNVPGFGELKMDLAYGGNYYVIIEPQPRWCGLDSMSVREILALSPVVRRAAEDKLAPVHPEDSRVHGVSHLMWCDKPRDCRANARNAVFYGEKAIDRSPCGTGSSARMAQLSAKGRLAIGAEFIHESLIGTLFHCRVEAPVRVGTYTAIRPSVCGSAYITGHNVIFVDARDPLAHGFQLL